MRVSSTPLAALLFGLPALCAAFLLPPDLHLTNSQLAALEVIPQPAYPESIGVSVRCTGCDWHKDAEDEAGVPYQPGLESDLLFNIYIPQDRQTLRINGAEILPNFPKVPLTALQIPSAVSPADYFTLSHSFRNLKIDYDILVANGPDPKANTQEFKVHFRFTSIDGVRNNGIEELQVVAHKDIPTMKFEIISVTRMPIGSLERGDDSGCRGWFECAMAMMHDKLGKHCVKEIADCHHGDNHMGDYPDNRGYNGGDHMEGWEGKHMGDGRRMKDGQRDGDHMKGDHRGEGGRMGGGQHMKDGQRGHRSGNHMEETQTEDHQHMRGDYMEGNHMKNSQHMKDNYHGQHMKDSQGHRSHHNGDWASHMADSQHMNGNNHIGYCSQYSGPHKSQWRKYPSLSPSHQGGNFMTRLIGQVFMPILVGILAGVGLSLAGLVFGKSVRKLYQVAVERGCGSVNREEQVDRADEEKGLLKGMESREELAALTAALELTAERPPAYAEEVEVAENE